MQLKNIKFNHRQIQAYLRDAVDESVAAEIFQWREYRSAEPIIIAAAMILDVGAHIGLFSLYCRALNPRAKICALEPEPENFKVLSENFKINKINGSRLAAALGATTSARELYLAPDNHNHYLLPPDSQAHQTAIKVRAQRLSDVAKQLRLKKIDLVKMDIEGGEYEIIFNLSPAEFSLVGAWLIEYHDAKSGRYRLLEKILRENGCTVQIFPSRFDKSMGFILARNKRPIPGVKRGLALTD